MALQLLGTCCKYNPKWMQYHVTIAMVFLCCYRLKYLVGLSLSRTQQHMWTLYWLEMHATLPIDRSSSSGSGTPSQQPSAGSLDVSSPRTPVRPGPKGGRALRPHWALEAKGPTPYISSIRYVPMCCTLSRIFSRPIATYLIFYFVYLINTRKLHWSF